jgi:hypothetical protein
MPYNHRFNPQRVNNASFKHDEKLNQYVALVDILAELGQQLNELRARSGQKEHKTPAE